MIDTHAFRSWSQITHYWVTTLRFLQHDDDAKVQYTLHAKFVMQA